MLNAEYTHNKYRNKCNLDVTYYVYAFVTVTLLNRSVSPLLIKFG